MRWIKTHEMLNISKIRKFPEHMYDIYKLSRKELGIYFNVWFPGKFVTVGDLDKKWNKIKKTNDSTDIIVDEMWTVKKTDEETTYSLYNREYNPVCVNIHCQTGAKIIKDDSGDKLYQMRAAINSIDDSSFTTWFMNKPLDELRNIRLEIMKFVDSKKEINGSEFIEYCESIGANPEQTHYD